MDFAVPGDQGGLRKLWNMTVTVILIVVKQSRALKKDSFNRRLVEEIKPSTPEKRLDVTQTLVKNH